MNVCSKSVGNGPLTMGPTTSCLIQQPVLDVQELLQCPLILVLEGPRTREYIIKDAKDVYIVLAQLKICTSISSIVHFHCN